MALFDEYAADPDVRGPRKRDQRRVAPRDPLLRLSGPAAGLACHRTEPRRLRSLTFVYEASTVRTAVRRRSFGERGFAVERTGQRGFVETPAPLRACPPECAKELVLTLLDVLRRSSRSRWTSWTRQTGVT